MNFPEKYLDLLKDETKAFLYLATSMADGSPQVTPIWFNTNGEYILINSAQGRTKDRNMRARPKVAMLIQDPRDPYRYLQIRGEMIEHSTEGAVDHIEALAQKYGRPWTRQPGQVRVIYKIKALHFDEH
jgi:PPOX class probable F420-dependent enzyme